MRLANQRVMRRVARRLSEGEPDWFTAVGGSMRPAVGMVQRVELRPTAAREPLTGRVVLVDVGGRLWLHRVTAEEPGRVHVAGDNGMVNGWTSRDLVFGVVD
jgi:hypothetical protein